MTTEINPRIVNGEPVCSGENCVFGKPTRRSPLPECDIDNGEPCIPALRAQRDAAIRERDEARIVAIDGALCDETACRCAGCNHYTGPNPVPTLEDRVKMALSLGWSYLYPAVLALALIASACGAPPGGLHLSTGECMELADKRDGAALAGKILAGVGGVTPLAAVPDEVPESARWGVGAGAAATAAIGVAVIWYGERKGEMFEAYCTSSASEPSTGDGGVE